MMMRRYFGLIRSSSLPSTPRTTSSLRQAFVCCFGVFRVCAQAYLAEFAETRRDFAALNALLGSLSIDPALLETDVGHVDQHNSERFCLEDHKIVGDELRDALDVFRAR